MAPGSPIRYQWQPGTLLRASTAAHPIPLADLDLYDADSAAAGAKWLATVWRDERVPAALAAASPVLCRQVDAILADAEPEERRVRRAVLSVASYLLRWNNRPTPFGAFAGVAPARTGPGLHLEWGPGQRTVLRPDADWMTDIILRLERSLPLVERLTVVANNTGHPRGDRHVVPGLPSTGRDVLLAPVEMSVRRTRPVAVVLDAARPPVPYEVLLRRLAEQFSAARPGQLNALLADLLSRHVLISSLWPPMTCVDTLTHVCAQLEKAEASRIPGIGNLARQLHALREAMDNPDTATPWTPGTTLTRDMHRLSDIAPVPLLVDTVLDCDLEVPEDVLCEAAEAVGVMYRLTPHPYGYPQWQDYHRRFRARYGVGALVPVLDLVADSGLGLPADYTGADRRRPPRLLTERDEKLLALLHQAMLDGRREIVLTRRTVEELAAGDSEHILPIPRAEVAVEIHAASPEAVQRGDYRLQITGTPRPGSSMFGRFAHLLPPDAQDRLTAGYAITATEAIPAQLSFAPRRRRNENVARTMRLLPHVIPLAEHHETGPGVLPLDDLAVTADARQFYLVQMSTGRRVEPRVPHALEAGVHTPPLARFLAEITTARCAVYKAFAFGAAARLPYLPRVRYKRTILAPARWLITAAELPAHTAPMADWEKALDQWRDRLRVPDCVAVVEYDQQLPVDLGQQMHRALLRTRLDSTRRIELRETVRQDERAWIGRPHELLIPLALDGSAAQRTEPPGLTHDPVTTEPLLPGRSTVLHARLHVHPLRVDEILTGHLDGLLGRFDPAPAWWFRRHRDTSRPDSAPYLELYLTLPDADSYGQAAAHVHDWAVQLHQQHLAAHLELCTYQPQTGRYGHGPAMDAAHTVFAADSAACLAQNRAASDDRSTAQALAAASMFELAVSFTGDADRAADWLTCNLPREHGPLDRALLNNALALANPARAALRSRPGGAAIATTWQTRAAALAAYREQLAQQRDPHTALRSLLHEHHIRALPVDPDRERITGRLVRACAHRHMARSQGAHRAHTN
ncbi:lantibiotic dehydratase [Streptomyces sp. F63]|uniref:lantibiotic dehydratase n=1 Tax=Streptomyces sp. F63 TaxID=2824887 RepID=UPI001B38880C|nr:lantibiotic dehydratase [Streptomyces sp. F63]MBQ0983727.1 lantibiotic dehydratase [Streptomyces sp. F63]